MKDIGNSFKVIKDKNIWPIMLAGTALIGAESAVLNGYGLKRTNEYMSDVMTFGAAKEFQPAWAEDCRGITAIGAYTLAPFILRLKSERVLKLFGGKDNIHTWNRLMSGSFFTAAAGTAMMSYEDNPYMFGAGLALTGAGFANFTNGGFKIVSMKLNAEKAAAVSQAIKAEQKTVAALYNARISSFEALHPAIHIGMAGVPLLATSLSKDNNIRSDNLLLGVPGASLAVGGIFGAKVIGFNPFKLKISPWVKKVSPFVSIPLGISVIDKHLDDLTKLPKFTPKIDSFHNQFPAYPPLKFDEPELRSDSTVLVNKQLENGGQTTHVSDAQ
jgi:hypothetical protein